MMIDGFVPCLEGTTSRCRLGVSTSLRQNESPDDVA
jgi:hypothetical protein